MLVIYLRFHEKKREWIYFSKINRKMNRAKDRYQIFAIICVFNVFWMYFGCVLGSAGKTTTEPTEKHREGYIFIRRMPSITCFTLKLISNPLARISHKSWKSRTRCCARCIENALKTIIKSIRRERFAMKIAWPFEFFESLWEMGASASSIEP